MTFFEFQKRFPTETAALNFIVATKYTNGYYCPKCGCFHKGIYRSNKRTKILHCNNCKSEFMVNLKIQDYDLTKAKVLFVSLKQNLNE